jgi:DNA-binding NarL/FixJ family response regulator
MIHLLLVDTQLILSGLKILFNQETDMQVVGTAANSEEAIAQAATLQPDILLIEAQMPTVNGKTVIQSIHERFPDIKVLVLSQCDCWTTESLQAGAKGYLLKDMSAEELPIIIRLVHRGHTFLAPNLLGKVLSEISTSDKLKQAQLLFNQLSPRQREIFNLMTTGDTNYQIAQQLHVAEGTIKSYVTSLLNHFNLKNRVQLAAYAYAVTRNQY